MSMLTYMAHAHTVPPHLPRNQEYFTELAGGWIQRVQCACLLLRAMVTPFILKHFWMVLNLNNVSIQSTKIHSHPLCWARWEGKKKYIKGGFLKTWANKTKISVHLYRYRLVTKDVLLVSKGKKIMSCGILLILSFLCWYFIHLQSFTCRNATKQIQIHGKICTHRQPLFLNASQLYLHVCRCRTG